MVGKLGTFKHKPGPDDRPEEGTLYLSSTGNSFKQPKIDAALISQYRENKAIVEGLDKLQRIMFQDQILVGVIDKTTGVEDPVLTEKLTEMCNAVNFDFKLQQLWRDAMEWGPGVVNPVWAFDGPEYRLVNMRRLDPLGFTQSAGFGQGIVRNRILPGIQFNPETGETEVYGRDSLGKTKLIQNVILFTDPIKTEVGGTPFIIPIVPLIKMLSFAWTGQMQKVNQHGSGGIWFIKVSNPRGDDKAYAQKILNNAGKSAAFQLRENMEVISLGVGSNGSALETISELGMQIRQFFSPSSLIQGDSNRLGGSNESEFKLYFSYIKGTHRWLERTAEKMLEPWLTVNAFDKYRLYVDIPEPRVDRSEFDLKLLDSAQSNRAILPNEARKAYTELGLELPELPPDKLAELTGSQQDEQLLQKARLVVDAIASNDMDPEHLIDESAAKTILNKALGLHGKEDET